MDGWKKKIVDNSVLPPSFMLLLWSWFCVYGLHVCMYYSSDHFLVECAFESNTANHPEFALID